jgi:phosphate transport system substrate-binding protein
MREDGPYIEVSEDYNVVIQRLRVDPEALGILGFDYLDQNRDVIQAARIDDVEPTFDNIADHNYPLTRPLYFYVKKAHVGKIPGLKEYVEAFLDDAASGAEGYLADRGLIPLPDAERTRMQRIAATMQPLRPDSVE